MTPGVSNTQVVACDRCGRTEDTNDVSAVSDKMLQDFLDCGFHKNLCSECLSHYKGLLSKAATQPVDAPGSRLIEGTHYYMENGFMVFTELYHVAKGYCCKSGCRHCAYGYKVDI